MRARHKHLNLSNSLAALAVTLALVSGGPASAQSTTREFQLPTTSPSPTPSSAPQGPADERAGVQIRPRVIQQSPTPVPTPTPSPASTPASQPTATPAPRPSASSTPAPASTRTVQTTPDPAPTRPRETLGESPRTTATPSASQPRASQSGTGASLPLEDIPSPGFDGVVDTRIPADEIGEPVGPDDWYNVTPDENAAERGSGDATTYSSSTFDALATRQNRLIAGIAIMVLLAGALAFLVWRRRRKPALPEEDEGPSLARGVSRVIGQQMSASVQDIAEGRDASEPPPVREPEPEPVPEPEPEPEAEPIVETVVETPSPAVAPAMAETSPQADLPPAKVDLSLDIIGATRSLMMFTVDFRLEIANRSDRAVRDLAVAGKLASAQRGGANAAPLAGGQPVGEIERIGPHQSRSISGQLQLPLAEVEPIMQGTKPLLIPLLHVTIDGKGCPAMSRSYVIGSPSLAGTGRVHPLPLDGTPGGLSGLKAQLVKSFETPVQTPVS